jgi:geranylgeranyl diphosphate synthase type I
LDLELPKHVDEALATYLADRRALGALMDENFTGAVDGLAAFVLSGGKRIRPTFAWWGWRAAGGDPEGPLAESVLTAVSSLELIQACALVHDDLMDASEVRRGKPTVHIAFAQEHRDRRWLGEPERFGLAAAVLIGDIALAWADDMLFAAGLPTDALQRLSTWTCSRRRAATPRPARRCGSTGSRPPRTPWSGRCTWARRSAAARRS